ncbi:hypothetical protein ACFQV2_09060 [Actinokineospora soli]|uniref:Fibronectin type-III domain-containing protein n=1 Tax=Actinokineospora soli TaxID=1048753 RepID=A0ABW2TIY3_9PSEU
MLNRTDTQVTLRVSWTAPATAGVVGYTLTAGGASKQSAGTTDDVTVDCGAICTTGGPISIEVAAYTATATGTPAVTTWTLPARAVPTTTTTRVPPPQTTTQAPPPPTTTTQAPPPRPPRPRRRPPRCRPRAPW